MRYACIAFVIFASFAYVAKAQSPSTATTGSEYKISSEIPGGIVYANNGVAIYLDLATGKETALTSDLKGAVVKWPFAASLNGEWVAWKQGEKFWLRQLPTGKPYPVQYNGNIPFLMKSNIHQMALSPDGARISIEAPCQGLSWILIQAGNISTYKWSKDSFDGIFSLSALQNNSAKNNNPNDTNARFSDINWPVYGNLVIRPAHPFFCSQHDAVTLGGPGNYVGAIGGIQFPESPVYKNFNLKKSARFLTFTGKKVAYFIYQTGSSNWGPFEIRRFNTELRDGDGDVVYDRDVKDVHARVSAWEIPIFPHSCEGIFARPDGSPSVLSNGNLYLANFEEIEKNMATAKAEHALSNGNTDGDFTAFNNVNRALLGPGFTGTANPNKLLERCFAKNNVFSVKWTKIAYGLDSARCINWVSNDSFLFLDKNNSLCQWKNGVTTTLRSSLASEFCYCVTSPFNTDTALGYGAGRAWRINTHSDLAKESPIIGAIKAGYIRTGWGSQPQVVVNLTNVGNEHLMEYCSLRERDFSKINLEECEWLKQNPRDKIHTVNLYANCTLVLRDGDHCSLIKIANLDQKQWPDYMDYEWESRTIDSASHPAVVDQHADTRETIVASTTKKTSKWSQLFKTDRMIDFYIGSLKGVHWGHIGNPGDQETHTRLPICFPANSKTLGFSQVCSVTDKHIEDIEDPSEYLPGPVPQTPGHDQPCYKGGSITFTLTDVGKVLIFRYSKLEGKYFAVELVKVIGADEAMVYKKRYWQIKKPEPVNVAQVEQP